MAIFLLAIGVKRFVERQMARKHRSPLEYVALTSLALLVAAIVKYPNRAIFTRARPDLKEITAPGHPLFGNLIQALTSKENPLVVLNKAFQKRGDIYVITVPYRGRFFMVNHPMYIEYILKTNFNNYIKGSVFGDQLRDILGNGIFVSDQDAWRFHRKTASNIFTTKMYRQLTEGAFTDSARDLCSIFDKAESLSQPVDLQQLFLKLTMDAFGKLTFGIEFNALLTQGRNEFGDAFDYLTANVDGRVINPLWPILDRLTPGKIGKLKRAIAVLDKYAYAAVHKRRAETPAEKEMRPRDLLDHFINHVREDGSVLSDLELRDVFVNFMIAGRDTTALTLTWQFYSLMANPRILKNVLKELDIVLQGSEVYTYETMMHELPYLKAVFHETLRLYPQVPRNAKECVSDDVLPDGTIVYKGELVAFSTYAMGRNRGVWGEDAEVFCPERWLVDEDDVINQSSPVPSTPPQQGAKLKGVSPFGKFKMENQFKFNSFNANPRLCLGQTFATLEAMVTSCMLLQNFDFKLVPGQPIPEPKPSATLPMLNPLMTFTTRKQQHHPKSSSIVTTTTRSDDSSLSSSYISV
ncbi:hypothetical protein BG015_006712 [Linnemannia schmuckeri]|uniref:Cytochrome P450 n=1 Tax=Linnemannia schmuckeri TaxID=64567 RepID=A0A9P5VBS4_9FUNG|nr:hypothetical protein BG015_006712 [Linnemannia schmuckeri]